MASKRICYLVWSVLVAYIVLVPNKWVNCKDYEYIYPGNLVIGVQDQSDNIDIDPEKDSYGKIIDPGPVEERNEGDDLPISSNGPKPRLVDFYDNYRRRHWPHLSWKLAWSTSSDRMPLPVARVPATAYDKGQFTRFRHKYAGKHSIFPSQGLIMFREGKEVRTCGCVLLHNDLIMTTRRCLGSPNNGSARVLFRRYYHQWFNMTIETKAYHYNTQLEYVKGFCVLSRSNDPDDYQKDIAIGFLESPLQLGPLTKSANIIPKNESEIVRCVGLVREDPFFGYNVLEKGGCSVEPGPDRTCWRTTWRGSRHICQGVDEGMGLYCMTTYSKDNYRPKIYLAGIMSQAERKPGQDGCDDKRSPMGQWAHYVDFKKLPRLKEMIKKCHY